MNFWTRVLTGLALVSQLLPAFLLAVATGRAQIRAIQVTAGSTFKIAGAKDGSDDLIITIV